MKKILVFLGLLLLSSVCHAKLYNNYANALAACQAQAAAQVVWIPGYGWFNTHYCSNRFNPDGLKVYYAPYNDPSQDLDDYFWGNDGNCPGGYNTNQTTGECTPPPPPDNVDCPLPNEWVWLVDTQSYRCALVSGIPTTNPGTTGSRYGVWKDGTDYKSSEYLPMLDCDPALSQYKCVMKAPSCEDWTDLVNTSCW